MSIYVYVATSFEKYFILRYILCHCNKKNGLRVFYKFINLIINATHINARLYNNIRRQRYYSLVEMYK